MPHVLAGTIDPGRVFDREVDCEVYRVEAVDPYSDDCDDIVGTQRSQTGRRRLTGHREPSPGRDPISDPRCRAKAPVLCAQGIRRCLGSVDTTRGRRACYPG
jgi:hypothetical protein